MTNLAAPSLDEILAARERLAGPEKLREGVYTASAGNMAQGVAWSAREMGVAILDDRMP